MASETSRSSSESPSSRRRRSISKSPERCKTRSRSRSKPKSKSRSKPIAKKPRIHRGTREQGHARRHHMRRREKRMQLTNISNSLLHCEGLIIEFQKDIAALTTHVNILRDKLQTLCHDYDTKPYSKESYATLSLDIERILLEVPMFINGLHLSTATIINNSNHVKHYLEKLKLINANIPQ